MLSYENNSWNSMYKSKFKKEYYSKKINSFANKNQQQISLVAEQIKEPVGNEVSSNEDKQAVADDQQQQPTKSNVRGALPKQNIQFNKPNSVKYEKKIYLNALAVLVRNYFCKAHFKSNNNYK